MQLRFGIAGLGVASTQILPYLMNNPQARIVAAADVRPSALDRFERHFGGHTFLSVEALCKSPDVDAIYVCTPNHFHADHAICAAEPSKPATVTTPMPLT